MGNRNLTLEEAVHKAAKQYASRKVGKRKPDESIYSYAQRFATVSTIAEVESLKKMKIDKTYLNNFLKTQFGRRVR